MQRGDGARSTDSWLPVVYDCLHSLAEQALRGEAAHHTLQPTALVHEAYVRLRTGSSDAWNDEVHFYAVAARVVRQVLVDHGRRKRAAKRGKGWHRITLGDAARATSHDQVDVLAVDEALVRLADEQPRAARVVELRFFGGLSIAEVATTLGVTTRTIDNDWRFARAWLMKQLSGEAT